MITHGPSQSIAAVDLEALLCGFDAAVASTAGGFSVDRGVSGASSSPRMWRMIGLAILVCGGCDPAYPTVCIPSPPPDLDCAQISFTNFVVKPPDPHGFDGDSDGRGCET